MMSENIEFDLFNQFFVDVVMVDVSDVVLVVDVYDSVDLDFDVDLDDLFVDVDMELEEDEGDEVVCVFEVGDIYVNLLDVGFKDKMWVLVCINVVEFKEKYKLCLFLKVCVVVKVDQQIGKKKIFVFFDYVEVQIQVGVIEMVGEYEFFYFICEVNYVVLVFGQCCYLYEIEVLSFMIKMVFFKEQCFGCKGFKNEDGCLFCMVIGVMQFGEVVNLKIMLGIVKCMEEKVVMVQIMFFIKMKQCLCFDGNNKFILVLFNVDIGVLVMVFVVEKQKDDDLQVYLYNDEIGIFYEGSEKLLVYVKDVIYVIVDFGENVGFLMEDYVQVMDYLKIKFMLVLECKVEVELYGGEIVKGEIIWDIVGVIMFDKIFGVLVDIIFGLGVGDWVGEIIMVVWLGMQWMELFLKKKDGEKGSEKGGGFDEFVGVKSF